MGVSTDAKIAFGINLGEELPENFTEEIQEGDSFDFDEWWLNENSFPAWKEGMSDTESTKYWADRAAMIDTCPVELILHCSYDYAEYILAVRGTHLSASRGYPEAFNPANLTVTDKQRDELKAFAKAQGIAWQSPKWFLFSLWG